MPLNPVDFTFYTFAEHVQGIDPSGRLPDILHSTGDALALAVLCLSEISEMTRGVPYIQTVSSLITHLIKVNDVCCLSPPPALFSPSIADAESV